MKLCLCAGCFLQNIDSTTSKFSKQALKALKALKARPRGTQFSRHCRWDLPLTELSGAIVDPVPKRSLGSEFPRSCLHWSSLVFLVHFQILLFTIPSFSLLLSLLLFASLLLSSLVFSCLLLSSLLFCTLFLSILLFSASLLSPLFSLPFLLLCFFYSDLIIFSFTLLLYCGHRPVALSLNMFKPMRAAWQPTPKVLRSVSLDASWRLFSPDALFRDSSFSCSVSLSLSLCFVASLSPNISFCWQAILSTNPSLQTWNARNTKCGPLNFLFYIFIYLLSWFIWLFLKLMLKLAEKLQAHS